MNPDEIQMCIVRDDWETPSGIDKSGLCSTYLTGTGDFEGGSVVCKVNAGVIATPDHTKPIILAALGTGLAPVRGILLDREHAASQGVKVAQAAMYYGCRHRKDEYYYDEEGLWE